MELITDSGESGPNYTWARHVGEFLCHPVKTLRMLGSRVLGVVAVVGNDALPPLSYNEQEVNEEPHHADDHYSSI